MPFNTVFSYHRSNYGAVIGVKLKLYDRRTVLCSIIENLDHVEPASKILYSNIRWWPCEFSRVTFLRLNKLASVIDPLSGIVTRRPSFNFTEHAAESCLKEWREHTRLVSRVPGSTELQQRFLPSICGGSA